MIESRAATLIGPTAILMWSLLAALTVATGRVPAFQLLAMTFAIGACIGPLMWLFRPGAMRALRQPTLVWLVGVGGLFGYHALFFIALRLAPPAEAGVVNYLWPLLIVLLSSLLPGERLLHIMSSAQCLALPAPCCCLPAIVADSSNFPTFRVSLPRSSQPLSGPDTR